MSSVNINLLRQRKNNWLRIGSEVMLVVLFLLFVAIPIVAAILFFMGHKTVALVIGISWVVVVVYEIVATKIHDKIAKRKRIEERKRNGLQLGCKDSMKEVDFSHWKNIWNWPQEDRGPDWLEDEIQEPQPGDKLLSWHWYGGRLAFRAGYAIERDGKIVCIVECLIA